MTGSSPALPAVSASWSATRATEAMRSEPDTITVMGVGDMIFDRRVAQLIGRSGGEAPLRDVASVLASADVTVGNLESTLSREGRRSKTKDVTFQGDPRGLESLTAAGFDLLSMANNHVLDCGPLALADTISRLDRAGIAHAGAGPDREAAWQPAIVERGGARIAFLSFSNILPPGFVATDGHAGLASGRTSTAAVRRAIADAGKKADHVIVSFHWGVEYVDDANGDQVALAHRAVDAGADMVLSHHPHVIQAVERYRGRLIAYSLGDFVFDHYSRKTGEAFILRAELGPQGVGRVSIIPVYLDTWGSPEIVRGDAASVILKRLKRISAKRGTGVVIEGDSATLAMP